MSVDGEEYFENLFKLVEVYSYSLHVQSYTGSPMHVPSPLYHTWKKVLVKHIIILLAIQFCSQMYMMMYYDKQ